jgi:eukaryotic-like serine/threonine-protein kinase
MFKFITRQPFWLNFIVGIVLAAGIIVLFISSLNWITHHGEAKTVPLVTGKNINEVSDLLDEKGFEMVIQDSVYNDTLPPSIVIKQVPEADAVVKVNRTVYVTVNRVVPPEVDMPNLIGYSYRNAEMVLKNMGLKMGDTTFRADFAKNSVLEQLYNGKEIPSGTKIRMGSTISLVLGNGLGNINIPVPKLIGLNYTEARILTEAQGLILGAVIADPSVQDKDNAYVYRQSPGPKTTTGYQLRIRPGQMIDIWLSVEPPALATDSLQRQ